MGAKPPAQGLGRQSSSERTAGAQLAAVRKEGQHPWGDPGGGRGDRHPNGVTAAPAPLSRSNPSPAACQNRPRCPEGTKALCPPCSPATAPEPRLLFLLPSPDHRSRPPAPLQPGHVHPGVSRAGSLPSQRGPPAPTPYHEKGSSCRHGARRTLPFMAQDSPRAAL